MIVSDMPRAIAEADGSPQNVEKIAATIKSAYEVKRRVQGATPSCLHPLKSRVPLISVQ